MHTSHAPRHQAPGLAVAPITIGTRPDGSLVYVVDLPPEAMPAVRVRDLVHAWELAGEAACAGAWGVPRGLRFHRGEGRYTDLALADRDAACWAAAVDRMVGLHTSYGMSLCLRLLALIDLLARAEWAPKLLQRQTGPARLPPQLLHLAASETLTPEAHFDHKRIEAGLGPLATRAVKFSGVCA
jgi:hypothetical protein